MLRNALLGALVLAYPFLVLAGLDHASARTIGALLLGLVVVATLAGGGRGSWIARLALQRFGVVVLLALTAAATDHPVALMLLPSATSLLLFYVFASSLRANQSIVAQFAAAAHDGRFPDFLLPYCRRVTQAWCGFFVANAVVAALLALAASPRTWALYTGGVAYALVAAMALAEYVLHKVLFRFYEDRWDDRLWRHAFPPEGSELGRRTLAWQRENGRPV